MRIPFQKGAIGQVKIQSSWVTLRLRASFGGSFGAPSPRLEGQGDSPRVDPPLVVSETQSCPHGHSYCEYFQRLPAFASRARRIVRRRTSVSIAGDSVVIGYTCPSSHSLSRTSDRPLGVRKKPLSIRPSR